MSEKVFKPISQLVPFIYVSNNPFFKLSINFDNLEIGGYTLQPIEDTGYVLRTAFLETDQTESVRQVFQSGGAEITREAAIGPSVGQELRTKAIAAIIIVSIGIISLAKDPFLIAFNALL